MRRRELDLIIFMGSFYLEIFYDSNEHTNLVHYFIHNFPLIFYKCVSSFLSSKNTAFVYRRSSWSNYTIGK